MGFCPNIRRWPPILLALATVSCTTSGSAPKTREKQSAAWASVSSDKILAWKLPRVVEPGTRIGFIDSCDWAVYRKGDDPSTYLKVNEYGYWDASPAASNYVAYRHGGNNLANVCYLDGHVNTEQAATLKNAEKSFKSFYKKY